MWGLLTESQGQNLALTVLHVPYSLESGPDPNPDLFRAGFECIGCDVDPLTLNRLAFGPDSTTINHDSAQIVISSV